MFVILFDRNEVSLVASFTFKDEPEPKEGALGLPNTDSSVSSLSLSMNSESDECILG